MPVEKIQKDTVLELESEPEGRIVVHGERNTVRIGKNVVLKGNIWLQGSGALIEIADGCHIDGMIHVVRGEGGRIRIGRRTTVNASGLSLHEAGEIAIGEDCMFSTDVHADVSDMHPIFDRKTGRRINPARSIHIGDHVWIGTGVWLMKGARIGGGSVVGAGSMVFGELPANVIATGTPAKVVRRDIEWRRDFDEEIAVETGPRRSGWRGVLARAKGRFGGRG